MEFNEKLQKLRKGKGLTQEELAQAIFVSRTAVSKWESGRGYPNIDSLKELANTPRSYATCWMYLPRCFCLFPSSVTGRASDRRLCLK